METSKKLKLNLVGIGSLSSKIVSRMYDETDCVLTSFEEFEDVGTDLESNEKHFETLNFEFDEDIKDIEQTFCFVDGKAGIAGATLAILRHVASKPITIFYIKQDLTNEIEKINTKITLNVLQEYARSGEFRAIYLFDFQRMLDKIINTPDSLPDEFTYNDLDNLVIDKIIFGAHIYWRLMHERYIQGNRIDFDSTIYKTNTFFESPHIDNTKITSYYELDKGSPKRTIWIFSMTEKMTKNDLVKINQLKKLAQSNESEIVILKSEEDFAIGIVGTNIVQESNYLTEYKKNNE